MKPVLKWAGGKSGLLDEIIKRLPNYVYTDDFCLIEPFVGGGAVSFWALSHLSHLKKLIINDYNSDLINVYQIIKCNPNELIEQLNILQKEYDELTDLESKKPYFYQKRALFNSKESHAIVQASLFIFLNKTAFNGLYRVNKNNDFNVPIGSYKKPQLINQDNILNLSKKLQQADILTGDFYQTLKYMPNNLPCVFYIDPPYRPISDTESFTAYANNVFDDDEQKRLAQFCREIHKLGSNFILSNSDPKNHDTCDDFFDDLYRDFTIDRVQANRAIGASSSSRKSVNEILVFNGCRK